MTFSYFEVRLSPLIWNPSQLSTWADKCHKTVSKYHLKKQHFEIGNLLENVSTMSNKYECEQCGKRCKNEKQLDLHVLQHKSVELIYCPESECSEEIVQKFLKDHLKIVHNVEIDQATTSWVQARTATGMDGTLPHCSFENLKPVEISKNCFNII